DAGTGQDSTAGLSRDTANANGSVANTFNAQDVQNDMAVQQGAEQVGMQVAGDIADQLAKSDPSTWGPDGAGRIALHAGVAAAGAALGGGNIAGAVAGTVAGDLAAGAVSNALGNTAGASLITNVVAGAAGAAAGAALGGAGGALSGANGALGAICTTGSTIRMRRKSWRNCRRGRRRRSNSNLPMRRATSCSVRHNCRPMTLTMQRRWHRSSAVRATSPNRMI
ncbi:hypothetical protein, partial [Paraburkholderia antibiotica]